MTVELEKKLSILVRTLDFKKKGADYNRTYEQYSLRLKVDKRQRFDGNYPLVYLYVSCPYLTELYAKRHPTLKIDYMELLAIDITNVLDRTIIELQNGNSGDSHSDFDQDTILQILRGTATVTELINAFESRPSWTIASRELAIWLIRLWSNPHLDPGPFPLLDK